MALYGRHKVEMDNACKCPGQESDGRTAQVSMPDAPLFGRICIDNAFTVITAI